MLTKKDTVFVGNSYVKFMLHDIKHMLHKTFRFKMNTVRVGLRIPECTKRWQQQKSKGANDRRSIFCCCWKSSSIPLSSKIKCKEFHSSAHHKTNARAPCIKLQATCWYDNLIWSSKSVKAHHKVHQSSLRRHNNAKHPGRGTHSYKLCSQSQSWQNMQVSFTEDNRGMKPEGDNPLSNLFAFQ